MVALVIAGGLEVEALGEGRGRAWLRKMRMGTREALEVGGGEGEVEGEGAVGGDEVEGAKSLRAVLAARMGSRKRASLAWAVATMLEEVRGSMSRRERAAAATTGCV